MEKPLFTGACTALVTPLLNGKVNYPMLDQLIDRQCRAGMKAIVVCGTTGEAPALSDSEKCAIVGRAKETAAGRCLILAGTGSNSTEHALRLSVSAAEAGADGLLIVSPYYNKATPEGLYYHYSAIAQAVDIPIVVYNVPSRTGLDIPVSVYKQLSEMPNIAGVKEASQDVTKVLRILTECPRSFRVWSGNDDQAVPVISMGGAGVISVVSNLLPEKTIAMAEAALDGDLDTASDLQLELYPLIRLLFAEVNPAPVKYAMKLLGYDCGECRLPLTAPSAKLRQQLQELLT